MEPLTNSTQSDNNVGPLSVFSRSRIIHLISIMHVLGKILVVFQNLNIQALWLDFKWYYILLPNYKWDKIFYLPLFAYKYGSFGHW
jgi:hypothetical protein